MSLPFISRKTRNAGSVGTIPCDTSVMMRTLSCQALRLSENQSAVLQCVKAFRKAGSRCESGTVSQPDANYFGMSSAMVEGTCENVEKHIQIFNCK